jgi:hypothetical protein
MGHVEKAQDRRGIGLNIVLEFLVFHIPWEIYAGLGLLVLFGLAYLFHVDSRHLMWIAGLLIVAIFSDSLAQKGWKAKEKRDIDDANKAIDRAAQARDKQKELNDDPKHLRDHDRYMRDD